jgi:hypothetical protein
VIVALGTLAAAIIYLSSVLLTWTTGALLLLYLCAANLIHRHQIRNPLSDSVEDSDERCILKIRCIAKLRRIVTVDEVEVMMSKEAELKARQERASPPP